MSLLAAAMAAVSAAPAAEAAASEAPVAAPAVKFSLDILDVIKTSQAQNGLRHNDYERYRAYCARRLARLNASKTVKTHSSSKSAAKKAYVKKALTPATCTDVRHLHVPLMNAERAWADAQLLGNLGDAATAATRNHRVNRLKKAAKWGGLLQSLAAERGDARTALEADAYAAWLRGTLAMEQEEWEATLAELAACRAVYEKLATVASRRLKELFAARVEELAPLEKFARWQQRRVAGRGTAAPAGPSDVLTSKIEAALAEAGALGDKDGDFSHVSWRGVTVPIKNDKLKASLAAAWSAGVTVADRVEAQRGARPSDALPGSHVTPLDAEAETAYLSILTRYEETARLAAGEVARSAKEGKEAAASDAKSVEDFARFHRARHMLDRNEALVAAGVRSYSQALTTKGEASLDATAPTVAAGKKGGKRKGAAAAPAAAEAPVAAVSAAVPTAAVVPANVFATAPLQAALLGLGAAPSATAASSVAAAAATQVAALYARSMKTLDEMLAMAGEEHASSASASASEGRRVDSDLVAALMARKETLAAQRCYYVAVALLASRKFTDATVMMARTSERATAALAAFKALPASVRGKGLPPHALPVDGRASEAAAWAPAVIASGISADDVSALEALLRLVANETIRLQATALLEQHISTRMRPDGSFAEAWAVAFGPGAPLTATLHAGKKLPPAATLPATLERSKARPSTLVERSDPCGASVATADPLSLATLPVGAVATPFKPFLFDTAASFLDYPDSLLSRAAALEAATKPKTAAAPPASAAKAPAAPGSATKAGTAAAAAASPSAAAAAAPASAGLFGWLTGGR